MSWLARIRNVLGKQRYETDMAEEMRLHLELRGEQLRAGGHSADAAHRLALREFGGVEQLKERCRDGRGLAWVERFFRDLSFAIRQLGRAPGFSLLAIVSLAIAIGASTTIFTLVNDFLLRSLPVRDPAELVILRQTAGARGGTMARWEEGNSSIDPGTGRRTSTSFAWPAFERFRSQTTALHDVFAFASFSQTNLLIDGKPEFHSMAQVVAGNYHRALGVGALFGRTLLETDDQAGAAPVAVISHRCWRARFHRDPAVVGRDVTLNGVAVTVIGVTPPGFDGALQAGESADFTLPLALAPRLDREHGTDRHEPWFWWLRVMGRLSPGATKAQARAELEPVLQEMARAGWYASAALDPGAGKDVPDPPSLSLDPGAQGENETRQEFAPMLQLLMAFVGLVVVAACANVANLLLARGAARRAELGVRLALGAGRARLVRQLLTESLLLAVCAAALGIGLAWTSRGLLLALHPFGDTTVQLDLPLDGRVLGFSIALALVTTLLFGLAPALRSTRLDLAAEFSGARALGSRAQSRLSRGLMILQVALSLVLLVGSGLILRTLWNLRAVDPGFNPHGLAFFRIEGAAAGYAAPQAAALQARITEELLRVPGVKEVTHSRVAVLSRGSWRSNISVEGVTLPLGTDPYILVNQLAPNFFDELQMPLVLGRGFTGRENPDDAKVVVINQALARQYFGTDQPIGRQIIFGDGSNPAAQRAEVIGVVRDAKYRTLREEVAPTIYHASTQRPASTATFAVRLSGDPGSVLPALRAAVRGVDPSLPVHDLRTLEEAIERLHTQETLFARLLGFFGLVAVALACVGLHGLMSFSVARRTGELGLRLTLGATRANVLALILRECVTLVATGLALGLVSAAVLARLLNATLYGLSPVDPATYLATAVLLLVTALVASLLPAWRASRIDPARALREA